MGTNRVSYDIVYDNAITRHVPKRLYVIVVCVCASVPYYCVQGEYFSIKRSFSDRRRTVIFGFHFPEHYRLRRRVRLECKTIVAGSFEIMLVTDRSKTNFEND